MADNCIFCKIINKEIPNRTVYEDNDILAFHDINPSAKVHFLIIPKAHISSMAELEDQHQGVMGKIMTLAPKLAKQEGCIDGFRLIINTGNHGRQEVPHIHAHVIGGEVLPGMIVRR